MMLAETLPTQIVALSTVYYQVELINSICHYLIKDNETKLVIMGEQNHHQYK